MSIRDRDYEIERGKQALLRELTRLEDLSDAKRAAELADAQARLAAVAAGLRAEDAYHLRQALRGGPTARFEFRAPSAPSLTSNSGAGTLAEGFSATFYRGLREEFPLDLFDLRLTDNGADYDVPGPIAHSGQYATVSSPSDVDAVEGSPIPTATASSPGNGAGLEWTSVTMKAYKAVAETALSRELVDDSGLDIVGAAGESLGRLVGARMRAYLVNGSGTGEPQGIATLAEGTSAGPSDISDLSALTAAHVDDVYYTLDGSARARGVWLMNGTVARVIAGLRTDTGVSSPGDETGPFAFPEFRASGGTVLHGRPVISVPELPSSGPDRAVLIYMDPKAYLIRLVRGIDVNMARNVGAFFANDLVGVRVRVRYDGRAHPDAVNAIARLRVDA